MGVMEKAVGFVEVMSDIERLAFVEVLREKGLLEAPVVAEEEKGGGGGGRGRGRKGYWMKEITGWDESKKGAFRAKGGFVRASEMVDGRLILMGWTAPDEGKRYALVEVDCDAETEIEILHVGSKMVKGVSVCNVFKTWNDFEHAAKARGLGI